MLNATPRRDEFGHVIGMVGIGQDITARIAQEQEYSKLIDTANAPIFGVDTAGKVTVWNKCAARISGYSSEDTMGHNLVQEFITEDFRASVQEVLDKALRGLEDSNFAFPLVTKDGRRLEILLNATSRRDVDSHIIGVVGIGQDITARLVQEQEYSRLIDTANAPIFGVDVDGKVNVWNKCAQALTGYMSQDVFGKDLVSIVTSQCSRMRLAGKKRLTSNFLSSTKTDHSETLSNPLPALPCRARAPLTSNWLFVLCMFVCVQRRSNFAQCHLPPRRRRAPRGRRWNWPRHYRRSCAQRGGDAPTRSRSGARCPVHD